MLNRRKRSRPVALIESLESRTLLSASYAVLVMQAPILPAAVVQTDIAPTSTPTDPSATLSSVLDAKVRTVPGGIYISIAASSTDVRPEAPTGTVDIYAGLKYIATVKLGGSLRSSLVLPAGTETILVTYKGDANFLPSQTAVLARLTQPTNTPVTAQQAANFAKNKSGERIRPTRFLSRINYFDAHNLTVGSPQAAAIPTPGGAGASLTPATIALPSIRYGNLSFSSKLPLIGGR